MKYSAMALSTAITIGLMSCGNTSRPAPNNRTYESAYNSSIIRPNPNNRTYESACNSSSTLTEEKEDEPYLENRLQTGEIPYRSRELSGNESEISVSTSATSECDVVVIVKSHGAIARNVYIAAGDSYTFHVPNGTYQVFFYGGKGWNSHKHMPNGHTGGFVANESYSKDSEVSLNYQGLEYELIPQQNGNFSTQQSDASEMF